MCKCERGLKFEMEHAREANWSQKTHGTNSTVVHLVARQNQKQQIYPLELPVLEEMVSLQTLFRRNLLVPSVFSRQQLNSETLPADFAGEVFHSQ